MGEVRCPVLTMKSLATDPHSDAQWMTAGHLVVAPNDTIAIARKLMDQRNFGSLPVVSRGQLVGIITDRDPRSSVHDPQRYRPSGDNQESHFSRSRRFNF